MIVVDASVLVAACTDAGPEGRWAERVLAAGEATAPHLVLVETANVLRRLERAGRVSPLEAAAAHRDVLALDLELVPYAPFARRVWELRHALSSYDGWYVALAEAIGAPLATLDRRLAAAAGPACRFELPPV